MRKVAIAALGLLLLGMLAVPALASHPEVSLPGSNFEIDTAANLRLDDPAPSQDWASVDQEPAGPEQRQLDTASGQGDESFGNGTKEDTAVPSVVTGGIPPNKSDLKAFGVYLETTATGDKFLNVFWARVQDPSGTTNMDFEFNKSKTLSTNGKTPVRTSGDILIQYDLSNGGVNPNIFISRWLAVGDVGACQAGNQKPCWSTKINLTGLGDATGSINTTAIPLAESDGLGALDPRTFGEAQIDFDVFAEADPDGCVGFGSAYLKSRSSDSFTSALKDFIPPLSLNFNECGALKITKTTKVPGVPGDSGQAGVTFTIDGPAAGDGDAFDVVTGSDGTVCTDGLATGSYSVLETVPAGYQADGANPKTATVTATGVGCNDDPYAGDSVAFSNTPLTAFTVSVDSKADGGTASTVDCVVDESVPEVSVLSYDTGANGDGTGTTADLLPGTYVCTIVIDP